MKRLLIAPFILAVCLTLVAFPGCASNSPKNANQWATEIELAYTSAADTGATYGELPICTKTSPSICAKATIVLQIKVAKDAAKPVIDSAVAGLRDPLIDAGGQQALMASANHALQGLTALTNVIAAQVGKKKVDVPS